MKLNFDELVKKETINLYGKGLDDGDLDVIIKILRDKDAAVKVLKLSVNNITLEDGKFTDALSNNNTLKELRLHNNAIGTEGTKCLATALTNNKTLKVLDLYNNSIGREGAKCLAAALVKNNTLRELDLNDNNIGAEGVKFLAAALKVNATLEEIWLGTNNIGDKGAKHFPRALMINKTLQRIDLDVNSISDEGAKSIAVALLLNQGIRIINMGNNKIGNQGADKLVEALEYNNTIETLWLGGNQMKNSMREKIDAIVKDTDRERKELTSQQLREIIAMKDEGLIAKVFAMKDASLQASEEEKKRLEREIFSKDREIASLKAAVRGPLKQLKKLELIVNAVDMTSDEGEPNSKRPRTEINAPKSMHAIMHEQNQKLVQVKQEKIAAETNLKNERGEKEAVERKMELELECKICFELKDETCALVPCGHIMCSGCAGGYTACPTCSRNVESRCRLYK